MASRAEVEGGAAWLLTVGSLQASASFAILSRFEELQHERELATAQEESILQEDLLPQDPPDLLSPVLRKHRMPWMDSL